MTERGSIERVTVYSKFDQEEIVGGKLEECGVTVYVAKVHTRDGHARSVTSTSLLLRMRGCSLPFGMGTIFTRHIMQVLMVNAPVRSDILLKVIIARTVFVQPNVPELRGILWSGCVRLHNIAWRRYCLDCCLFGHDHETSRRR